MGRVCYRWEDGYPDDRDSLAEAPSVVQVFNHGELSRMPGSRIIPNRRTSVLLAARRCLAREGLDRLTMRMIAREAGVSLGTVTYYFRSKEDLLTAVLFNVAEQFDRSIEDSCPGEADPYKKLLAYVANSLPVDQLMRELWLVWLEFWNRASRTPELSPLHYELYGRWRREVAGILEAGIDAGHFRQHDTELFAKMLLAVIDGLAVNAVVGDPEVSSDEMSKVCLAVIEPLLVPEGSFQID